MTQTSIPEKQAIELKDDVLEQQKRLRDKLAGIDVTSLTKQEERDDYVFCVNKNFLAIKYIREALLSDIVDRMSQNEDEIKDGIKNLKQLIDQVNSQAALLSVLDRIIAIVIRVVSIFSPAQT